MSTTGREDHEVEMNVMAAEWAMNRTETTSVEQRMVLIQLAARADEDGRGAVSLAQLAQSSALTVGQVERHLAGMSWRRVLVVEVHDGRVLYRLPLTESEGQA
ncbi:hypothetical protein HDA30_000200 [Micrococcus cohnii]|uniref:Winged helix-turn-helix domain-containing protein n=1 Tax=Micrococcus cohnii TaxID=993416 RepID=A0A7W7GM85_9MICC|nr:hypothetical protein [Micrococcus cohnii]MBB4734692.1 hypothetical protein [Micrococcus cohnii]